MRQLLATLSLIGILVNARIVYPQTLKVVDVEECDGGYTLTLVSSDEKMYGTVTELDDVKLGELVAVLMYDNMTVGNTEDDTVIAMCRTGFFEKGGG